jgi:hypothetical protein
VRYCWCFRFALRNKILGCSLRSLAPLSFKQALRFRQCSLASVGFLLLVGEHHNEEKIHDIKTPSQRIALLEAKLARAKALFRTQATNGGSSKWAQC